MCIHNYKLFSAEADFSPIVFQDIVFDVDTTGEMCFNILIENDDILENTEVLRILILPTNDPALSFEETILSVGIEDDDSKAVTGTELVHSDHHGDMHICRCGSEL